jgi:hypothetical protein
MFHANLATIRRYDMIDLLIGCEGGARGMTIAEHESLAEDLLLLALHNERGTIQLDEKQLRSALATATVMDLMLGGKIAAMDGDVIVVDRTPMNDPVCDHALRCIGATRERMALSQCGGIVETGIPDIVPRLQDGLVARGILRRESSRRLGILPAEERFPEQDGRIEQGVRARLRAVALQGAKPDARTAVLAALVVSYRLDTVLFNEEERPLGQAQLRDIALQLHQRPQNGASAMAGSAATAAHTAGVTNVSGNAFVDFMADGGVGAAFELIFDVIPTLLGGLLDLLSIFDS